DLARCEHVPAGANDRVLDGADRAAVTELGLLATVEGLQIATVGADRGERGVLERVVEPLAAFAGADRATLAGGLIVAGTLAGPRRDVARGWKDAHIDADLGDDVLGRTLLDAGLVQRSSIAAAKGASCSSIAAEMRWICSSRKSICARMAPIKSACRGSNRPSRASRSAGILARILPFARSARISGSVVPAISASSIARPDLPRMSVATQSSLMPVSSSALCSRFVSR